MADRQGADRGKAVEAALANIEKKFGKGSIMRLGDKEVIDIPAISTTSLSLDAAVVGSALVAEVERHAGRPDLVGRVGAFARSLIPR